MRKRALWLWGQMRTAAKPGHSTGTAQSLNDVPATNQGSAVTPGSPVFFWKESVHVKRFLVCDLCLQPAVSV